jgi:hypothetical protein
MTHKAVEALEGLLAALRGSKPEGTPEAVFDGETVDRIVVVFNTMVEKERDQVYNLANLLEEIVRLDPALRLNMDMANVTTMLRAYASMFSDLADVAETLGYLKEKGWLERRLKELKTS